MIRVLLIWIEGRECIAVAWGRLGEGLRGFWVAFFEGLLGCHCTFSISLFVWGRGKGYMCRLPRSVEIIS